MARDKVSEKIITDENGKPIGYELEGALITGDDFGIEVEIRPRSEKSAAIRINCMGHYGNRPEDRWDPEKKLKVIVTQ